MEAPRSDPPVVKRERARIDGLLRALGMLIAAVTDWAIVGAASMLLYTGRIDSGVWLLLVTGAGAGTVWKKLTGQGPGSSTMILVSMAPAMKATLAGVAGWMGRH